MRVDVVTFLSPRPEHPKWVDYLPLLELQRRSALKFGHAHSVVTDKAGWVRQSKAFVIPKLPDSLMHAILTAQIYYLEKIWNGRNPVVLVDADCLVGANLQLAFQREFDLLLTNRNNPESPINNGAMYVAANSKPRVVPFFKRALELCGEHWGGDQEAIAAAAAPVPLEGEHLAFRGPEKVKILFGSPLIYNVTPKERGRRHKKTPYVIHFKGETKEWMSEYARLFVLSGIF